MLLLPGERVIFRIIAVLLAAGLALAALKRVALDPAGYGAAAAIVAVLLGLGQIYRRLRPEERLALALTGSGLFIAFTIVGSLFNYMLMPLPFSPFGPIDHALVGFDARLSYDWAAFATAVSAWPMTADVLRVVYFTSLPQIALMIVLLSCCAGATTLHHFLLTGVVGALLAITCWFVWPSFGASAVQDVSAEVMRAMPIAVDAAYGREVVRLAHEGVTALSPATGLGLIGFPSFHTVIAFMCLIFSLRLGWKLALPIVALNLVMMPALLVQGGHHLTDAFGGAAAFAMAYVMAGRIVARGDSMAPSVRTRTKAVDVIA